VHLILFYLKKIISFFIMPYGFAITLLLLSIIAFKKGSKRVYFWLTAISFIVLFISSYRYITNTLLYPIEHSKISLPYKIDSKSIKYIHILGSGYSDDTTLPISSRLSESGLKRVLEGYFQYKKYPHSKLIITGYRYINTNVTYTQVAVELLQKLGVPRGDIIATDKTKDTEEEAKFAHSIVGEQNYILVTSASHMKRALYIMMKYNLHPIPIKTDYHSSKKNHLLIFPNPMAMRDSQTALHEYIGLLWYKIKDIIE